MRNKSRLLTPGPTQMPERVRLALAMHMIHHRKNEFRTMLGEVEIMLQKLFGTSQTVIPLSSSGTGAMTAAVHSLFNPGDEVIIVNGGKFGERWVHISETHGLSTIVINVPWGQAVSADQVRACLDEHPNAKGVMVQVCETSTGVLHPVKEIAAITRTRDVLLLADGISAVGISPCPMDEYGIDCLLTGSQKGLMVPPGLGIIALSERAWKRAAEIPVSCFYFDLIEEKKELEARNQTRFTSSISLLHGLNEALCTIFRHGENSLDALYHEQWALTCMVRAAIKELGLQLFAEDHYSWGLTSVLLPEGIDGTKMIQYAEDNYGVIFGGGMGDYKGRIVRIGHMGWVDWSDALAGLTAFAYSYKAVGGFTSSRSYLEVALDAYHTALTIEPGTPCPDSRA